jgi:hypothetical protein
MDGEAMTGREEGLRSAGMSEADEFAVKPHTPRHVIEAAAARLRGLGPDLAPYNRGVRDALAWLLGVGPLPFPERMTYRPPDNPENRGHRARVAEAAYEVMRNEPERREYATGVENTISSVVQGLDELPPYAG